MTITIKRIALVLLGFAIVTLSSCDDGKKEAERLKAEQEKVEMELEAEKAEMMKKEKEEAEKKQLAMANSIAGKAMGTADLSTLVTALKTADLAALLSEPGTYTVFAPSNNAFSKLPEGTVDELLKPENKENLQSLLQYHVVMGEITSDKLAEAIKGAKGSYTFETVTGESLTAMMSGDQFVIKDASGKKAQVVQGNVEASNGIIYIIDTVLMAKK